MIKTLLSLVFSGIIAISFSAHSKTKVTWSMESNADRDPIFLEKLQNAYNSAQNNYELEILKNMIKLDKKEFFVFDNHWSFNFPVSYMTYLNNTYEIIYYIYF